MAPNLCKIVTHYNNAREKHPCFADKIVWDIDNNTLFHVQRAIEIRQYMLATQKKESSVSAESLLMLKLNEFELEFVQNNTTAAIKKAYDCITVLLRIIDVLEGRQKLGKPEEEEEEVTND